MSISRLVCEWNDVSVDVVAELLARFEADDLAGLDGNFCAGLGVSAFACAAFGHFKSTKPYERNLISGFERIADGSNDGIHNVLHFCLGHVGFFSDLCDEFCFVHKKLPPWFVHKISL